MKRSKEYAGPNERSDCDGPIHVMVSSKGYLMVRRPACSPFLMTVQQYELLPVEPLPDGASEPMVRSSIVCDWRGVAWNRAKR